MESGYTRLYRKLWKNPVLNEPNKPFSRREAWLHLVNVQAQGIARNGLKRGEFEASIRYLARSWNWSKTKVERFMADLQNGESPMIMRLGQQTGHFAGHFAGQQTGHFIICEYETYNPIRDTSRDSKRDTLRDSKRDKLNKRLKERQNKEKGDSQETGEMDPERKAELRRIFAIETIKERKKALQDYSHKYEQEEAYK